MKRVSNTNKKIGIVIVIFSVFIGIFFLLEFLSNITKYKIFVFNKENFILYQESNKEWFNISKKEFIKKYSDKSYLLYVGDNKISGTFKFDVIANNLEMVNRSNNILTRYTKDNWVAYAGSSKMEYIKHLDSDISIEDEKLIFKQLKKYKLNSDYNVSYFKKYTTNIDSDISAEKIYIISNMTDYDKKNINKVSDKLFSFMLLNDDNKIYTIYSKVSNKNNTDKLCIPSVESILKFSNNSYKIFSYCDYVSKDAYELMLYNYQNNKFTNIKINN